jgi:hypothetical protein
MVLIGFCILNREDLEDREENINELKYFFFVVFEVLVVPFLMLLPIRLCQTLF